MDQLTKKNKHPAATFGILKVCFDARQDRCNRSMRIRNRSISGFSSISNQRLTFIQPTSLLPIQSVWVSLLRSLPIPPEVRKLEVPAGGLREDITIRQRLAKLVLHGMTGPVEVKGRRYPGTVPMIPFKHLSDEEIAGVLTYIRNAFGHHASVVTPAQVQAIRRVTQSQTNLYTPEQLLKEHPK